MLRYLNIALGGLLLGVMALAGWAMWAGDDAGSTRPAAAQAGSPGQAADASPAREARPAGPDTLARLFSAPPAAPRPQEEEKPIEPPQARLTGLVLNQGETMAIVMDSKKAGQTTTLSLGSKLGPWTVTEIRTDSVVLENAKGKKHVLTLIE